MSHLPLEDVHQTLMFSDKSCWNPWKGGRTVLPVCHQTIVVSSPCSFCAKKYIFLYKVNLKLKQRLQQSDKTCEYAIKMCLLVQDSLFVSCPSIEAQWRDGNRKGKVCAPRCVNCKHVAGTAACQNVIDGRVLPLSAGTGMGKVIALLCSALWHHVEGVCEPWGQWKYTAYTVGF